MDFYPSFCRFATTLALILPVVCTAQSPSVSPSTIYEKTHTSVVVIIVLDENSNPLGQGSGFIVRRGRVVTNHHVIAGAASAVVVFADGKAKVADGIAADSDAHDLAILAVETGTRAPLRLGDELAIKQGDSVYALGAPRGLELSLTNGIVSGFREMEDEHLLQTTAAIAPGSSGGPLFDSSGRVIGVTTALLSDSPGIYFSVAARDVSHLLLGTGPVLPFTSNLATKSGDTSQRVRSEGPPDDSLKEGEAPLVTKTWHNLNDGRTYRSRSNGKTVYLESDDDPLNRVSDFISCKFHLAVSLGLDWIGECWERNRKDGSSYKSVAFLNIFSETRIEGRTNYIPKFVMNPVVKSTNQKGLLVSSHPGGADIFINGIKQPGQTPASLPLTPGQYNIVLRLNGFKPYVGIVEIRENAQTTLDIRLEESAPK